MDEYTEVKNCGQCRGSGIIIRQGRSSQCQGCGGSGYVRVNKPAINCGQCRGSGIIIRQGRSSQCQGCGGNGYFNG